MKVKGDFIVLSLISIAGGIEFGPIVGVLLAAIFYALQNPDKIVEIANSGKNLLETAKSIELPLLSKPEEPSLPLSGSQAPADQPTLHRQAELLREVEAKPNRKYPKAEVVDFDRKPSSLAVPVGTTAEGRFIWLDLEKDILHCAIYGTSGCGKDHLLRLWYLSLLDVPVKWAILDGKGDWLVPQIEESADHLFPPAGGFGDEGNISILVGISAIIAEAKRRLSIIREAGLRSVSEYNQKVSPDNRIPLLIVLITDVIDMTDEIETLIISLISKVRSLEMRVVLSMQTPTGKKMQWRANVSTVLAGALLDSTQDTVALGIRDSSALVFKPSQLPPPPESRGLFVLRHNNELKLIRTPVLTTDRNNEEVFDEILAKKRDEKLLSQLLFASE